MFGIIKKYVIFLRFILKIDGKGSAIHEEIKANSQSIVSYNSVACNDSNW